MTVSDKARYRRGVLNIEGESSISAAIVTYNTRADMLADTNRTGVFEPNTAGFGRNIVGSGSDGSTYWNVFNIEGESSISAAIVTYGTLADMLADTNRIGVFEPNTAGFGRNIVGSGAVLTSVAAVPEPAALLILGSSTLALAVLRRRRRTG
ncbi:PEP-CTERM sorting domain-containing protein [Falsiroseomonas oryzae]|uniref:PEP-CTERM sorting domain-containing protein n=1 Tax=Falsiroseomonas oryzae TaxID=2766473 RepID=UPI0022EA2064|nr:PEP-CTERM sorting domain-containing protein [Roseomonas sp. MO-31]